MKKLVAQVVVAASIAFVAGFLKLPTWATILAVIAGAVAVHLVWERLFFNPFVYLGCMPFAPDDPLMLDAYAHAKSGWNDFLKLYPERKTDSIVRFAFTTDTGTVEHLWGDLLEISDATATVYLRTPPASQQAPLDSPKMTVPLADVNDWQIEFRDGTLRGGFTMRAMFKIYERLEGHVHPALREQLARYRDVSVPDTADEQGRPLAR